MTGLNSKRLEAVFQSRPDILQGIVKAADTPARVKLFNEIVGHVYDQLHGSSEPAHKKRKVDASGAGAGPVANGNGNASAAASSSTVADVEGEQVLLEIKDISVSIPQRKKFDLCFTSNHLYARSSGGAPVQGMVYAWKDIEYSFYLPVPDKTQLQYNYILMPKGSTLLGLSKNAPVGAPDPLVFTVPSGAPKPGTIGGSAAAAAENFSDSFSTLFHWSLSANLPQQARLVAANPDKFKSAIRQAQRPKEPAVHVKAFRGSKEGYLFFLDNGILWGFRKPLLFIPLSSIAAVSYCNVLRTTFNMVVEVFVLSEAEGEEKTEEVEFGMLDQADYPGIDESYVKKNRLQDRSMAEQRKAKKEMVENERKKNKGEDGEMAVDGEGQATANGRSILEQAHWEEEQRLQDEEDEDEEDYDPGSGGESEGSVSSDDDDDDDDDDEDDDDGDDGDE